MGRMLINIFKKDKVKKKEDYVEITKVILYLINNNKRPMYIEGLQKMLFYTQFNYYFHFKKKWLDYDFYNGENGAFIVELSAILKKLSDNNVVYFEKTGKGVVIRTTKQVSLDKYTFQEKQILRSISSKFGGVHPKRLIKYFSNEVICEGLKDNQKIELEEAKNLNRVYLKLSS